MRSWSTECIISCILFYMLFALWFNFWFIGFNFAFLWSSSVVNLGGYKVSLYACLSALFWILWNIASLLLDNAWVVIGGYPMIGRTNTLVLAFVALNLYNLVTGSFSLVFYAFWITWSSELESLYSDLILVLYFFFFLWKVHESFFWKLILLRIYSC